MRVLCVLVGDERARRAGDHVPELVQSMVVAQHRVRHNHLNARR